MRPIGLHGRCNGARRTHQRPAAAAGRKICMPCCSTPGRNAEAANAAVHDGANAAATARRSTLLALASAPVLLSFPASGKAELQAALPILNAAQQQQQEQQQCLAAYTALLERSYLGPGPLQAVALPRLEHTAASCFPYCVGDTCLLRIDVTHPKGGAALGLGPPYPLAIITGGFLVASEAYKSTAERLATWGYTVLRYDKTEAVTDVLDDVISVALLRELLTWAESDPLMRRLADPSRVYLCGHSRGGKLSALAAAADERVAAMCLLDPVGENKYAPLSDRYPSAVAALRTVRKSGRFLPVAVVGSGLGGDCAPVQSNYRSFFQASPAAAWEVLISEAGHFQFLDSQSALQRAVCTPGMAGDAAVRSITQAVMVAFGEVMLRAPGRDVLSCVARHCDAIAGIAAVADWQQGQQQQQQQQLRHEAPDLRTGRERLDRFVTRLQYAAQSVTDAISIHSSFRNF